MATPHIAVIGSLNIDFVTLTSKVPSGGETIHAVSHKVNYGGKGANQASACARLTHSRDGSRALARVSMVGNVGGKDRHLSSGLVDSLVNVHCSTERVSVLEDEATGSATIIVEQDTGENRILVVPAANARFGSEQDLVPDGADVVLFQHEIPEETVWHNIKLAKRLGAQVVHNPAPAVPLPKDLYACIDHLIMNASEAILLYNHLVSGGTDGGSVGGDGGGGSGERDVGLDPDGLTTEQLTAMAERFSALGSGTVIVTLGGRGCFYHHHYTTGPPPGKEKETARWRLVPAGKVDRVVDTTGAGDAFVAAYAVRLAQSLTGMDDLGRGGAGRGGGADGDVGAGGEGEGTGNGKGSFDVDEAVRFAIGVAGRSVQFAGAREGVPWLDEMDA